MLSLGESESSVVVFGNIQNTNHYLPAEVKAIISNTISETLWEEKLPRSAAGLSV